MKYVPRFLFEIELEYTRSRGPGGQHVNRTNSAALLRWNLLESVAFTPEDKELLQRKLSNVLSSAGDIVLRSDEFRDQERNKDRCLEKLDELLDRAFFVPKKRKPTKPTRSSQIKRKDQKRQRGAIKAARSKVHSDDY